MNYKKAIVIAVVALVAAFTGNIGVAETAQDNCIAINKINEKVRAGAKRDFKVRLEEHRRLDANGKLLGIKITSAIRARSEVEIAQARYNLILTLEEYSPSECKFLSFP